jgi:hypothetical protein
MTRRDFLRTAVATAGLAAPGGRLGSFISGPRPAKGVEVPTIEGHTKGRIKAGDVVTKDNVDAIKALITPGTFEKVVKYGMQLPLYPTTTEPGLLVPERWLQATERNRGQAVLDTKGQLWTKDGQPWIGGFPFPEPKTGLEMMWNMASPVWTEYADDFCYLGGEHLIAAGHISRSLEWIYAGIGTVGRIYTDPRPYYPDYTHELYRLVLTYTQPFDYKGTSILTVRPYDQTLLERASGYIPAVRRVRQFPTSQRWESPAGNDIFRSDLNGHNDPLGYWDWRLVTKQPMLGTSLSDGYQVDRVPAVAGRFPRGRWELRPEVYVVEGVPKDPASPYSKKILYVDGVMRRAMMVDFYDRRGELWKTAVYFFARLGKGAEMLVSYNHPHHCMDLQADHVTYIYIDEQARIKNLGAKVSDRWTEKALLRVAY